MCDTQVIQSHSDYEYIAKTDIRVLHVSRIYFISYIGISRRKYPF